MQAVARARAAAGQLELAEQAARDLVHPDLALGSVAGARLVLYLKPAALKPIILVLLVGVAAFLALRRPKPADPTKPPSLPLASHDAAAIIVLLFLPALA